MDGGLSRFISKIFGLGPRIAIVCRGGPENGPFSAMAARVITEVLARYGLKVSAIYTCSGSAATSLMGCIGEYKKLCDIWVNVTPEKITGKTRKAEVIYRIISRESFFKSAALRELIVKNWDLDRIFSSEAILAKFPAVDALTAEYIIFSNKNPKHKKWFDKGVLGSKALIPFLPPQIIENPEDAELIEAGKSKTIDQTARLVKPRRKPFKAMLLIDGGYKGNMLLEEAQRDGFNVIFLIDLHGLKPTETDLGMKLHWSSLIRIGQHILSNTNDNRQFQISDRINEEIVIKEKLIELTWKLQLEQADELRAIVSQMDEGRLRLGDKTKTQIYMVSNEEYSTLFNFAKFDRQEVLDLMTYGREAAIKTLQKLGFDTAGI